MTLVPPIEFAAGVFLFGLFFGSFFNVCIYRIPRRKSIVYPPSFCPNCRTPIRFYDNIPLVSFLVLLGRCRKCGTRISWRYPLVELLTGLLFLALAVRFEASWIFLRGVLLTCFLIVLAGIDLDVKKIPDVVSLPGLAVGVLSGLLVGAGLRPAHTLPALHGLATALVGAGVGALVILLAGLFGRWLFRREAMGQGDIVLAALIGSYLGWKSMLLAVFVAAVIGVLLGTILALAMRNRVFGRRIPFGPYLALAALLAYFWGPAILSWYWRLLGH